MIGSFDVTKLKGELSLGEDIDPQLLVALGKPAETVVLEDMEKDASTSYYRDENGVHHVPKRKLSDIVIDVE
jgi:hypothetical protein